MIILSDYQGHDCLVNEKLISRVIDVSSIMPEIEGGCRRIFLFKDEGVVDVKDSIWMINRKITDVKD